MDDDGPVDERLVRILNDAGLALMISLGHRAGLFESMADGVPRTAADVAARSGLDPRYVREWLGAMTVGRLVDHDPDTGGYALPADVAAMTTAGGEADLAAFMQYVAVLGGVEDQVLACFRHGGGVGYDAFPRFQAVMEADSAQTVLAALEEAILPLVPGLVERLERGIDVLDVGCGRGRALTLLAARHPRSSFTGVDLSPEAVAHARTAAEGLDNLRFVVGDAAGMASYLPASGFDLVTTFDAVHDQADPAGVVRAIRTLLREDGVYLAQDIDSSGSHAGDLDHPLGPFLYTISTMHCMTVSLAVGGAGLGTMWGVPAAEQMLREAGFAAVKTHRLPHDLQNAYFVARPGPARDVVSA